MSTEKLNINQWAEEDRPREKLMRQGAEALSDAELLAILVGSGSTKETAVELMKRVLSECDNNLNTLGKMTISELCKYNGIGEAKAITIIAACELGKRRQHEKVKERKKISNSQDIYEYMHPMMQDLNTEEAWVLLMNQNFKLIKSARISRGGITETSVDVRIIIKEAVLANATVIALCHNHPSGNIEPSAEDNRITEKVRMACKTMRLHFLDHVIVTDGGYYSFHDNGR
ncbi:MAG: DNA repair protein RadC [Prevotella sp.]|jgi:DNA repair protein RadC|nr:DNA repair protein RadC [Prevotella sp.]